MLCKLLKVYDARSRKLTESSRIISRLITPKLEALAQDKSVSKNWILPFGKDILSEGEMCGIKENLKKRGALGEDKMCGIIKKLEEPHRRNSFTARLA